MQTRLVSDPASLVAFGDELFDIAPPMQIEHDPRWLAETDHGHDAMGAALALYRDSKLVGYVPVRHRTGKLRLRLGEVTVASLPYRMVQLFGYGVLGYEEGITEAAIEGLAHVPLPFDAIALQDTPTDSPLFRALSEGRGSAEFTFIEQARALHHIVELPGSFPEYLERFTSKRRNGFRRAREKITAELGPISLSVFMRSEEMRPMLEVIGPVATKTFHYRLLGQDLTVDNERLVRNLQRWANRGWVRAYVLRAGGDVLAYVIGFVLGNRFFYEIVGYDPNRAAYSPGSVLLLRILEELTESRVANILDFGAGDADYKRFFGTSSWEDGNVLLARRTLYAQSAASLERSFASVSRRGAEALDRLGWKSKLKAILRSPEIELPGLLKPHLPFSRPIARPADAASREARDG